MPGKNGGMSRFVFLPADSECDQLAKRRNTEFGGWNGGGGWLAEGRGVPNRFHRESLWLRLRVRKGWRRKGRGEGTRGVEGRRHQQHNDRQKDFSVIWGSLFFC